MYYYFTLQYRMLNRQLRDAGLHPAVGYVLALLIFAGVSVYLFKKTELAVYLYLFAALALVFQLSDTGRNDFLKSCFEGKTYRKLRFLENELLAFPFVVFLVWKGANVAAGGLAVGVLLPALFQFTRSAGFTLPTPFSRRPFEFAVGFRAAFGVLLIAFSLAVIAVVVDNFNLGLFSLLLIFLISLSFYGQPESKFFVWVHTQTARAFLWKKITTGLWHATILSLPVFLLLAAFFSEKWLFILLVQGLGYLYLIAVVAAKYATYPQPMGIPQSIMLGLGMWFPPLLLGVIPFFFLQSEKRLHEILHPDDFH